MPRPAQNPGTKDSQKWMQVLVNRHPSVLEQALQIGPVAWRSPLESDALAEYWDASFLELLGAPELCDQLSVFWPRSGPRWDALGINKSGALVLVEAKSHAHEMLTATAASARSLPRIQDAFKKVSTGWGVSITPQWTSEYYQYANRLAHAFFLNEVCARPAIVVFLHIVSDAQMRGPNSRRDWETIIDAAHHALGVRAKLPPYVVDAFVDVRSGTPVAA